MKKRGDTIHTVEIIYENYHLTIREKIHDIFRIGGFFVQREITQPDRLLNEEGELKTKGYSKKMILEYDRQHIKAPFYKIKEWDYYLIGNEEFAIALTVADNSYLGLVSVSLLDFRYPWYKTTSVLIPFTFGRLKLPSTSQKGNIQYKNRKVQVEFLNNGVTRNLRMYMKNFNGHKDFECDFLLYDEPEDSVVMAIPFEEDRKAFYYNQKINCIKVQGIARYDDKEYAFHPKSSFATLDWGRGVWTYNNTWYWGSASGLVDGKPFGFNIGYGFGDTSAATENMLFYEGKAHKLLDVSFEIPIIEDEYKYMEQWRFTSSDQRFEMSFTPILDREDFMSVGIISSDQHQVFGLFSGRAVLDNGEIIHVENFLGFAERVSNKW